MIAKPKGVLAYRSSILTVLPDSSPFHGLFSPIWGPEVLYMVTEPQGALTYRSSTLIDLADSSPFRGLLLTVLGSRSDFHD